MCVRRVLLLVPVLLVMLTSIAAAERREDRDLARRSKVEYVDMDIELRVVERDDVNGSPLVPGNTQKLRVVDTIRRGGIVKIYYVNGERRAEIVRRSSNPVVWWVSRAQADLILHDGSVPWVLVQGSEGSGKTTVLVMWLAFRVLDHVGFESEIGLTAPTSGRIKNVQKEIKRWWPKRWFHFSARDLRYSFHAGPAVQCISAVQRSEAAGSPVQGNNWVAHGGDEFQDHQEREADIIARGRSAPDLLRPDLSTAKAWYPRLLTSTFKDAPAWRDFRGAANDNKKDWHIALLLGLESPFIGAEHWERFKRGVTLREYQRRVLAMDVGPEKQVYYSWSRDNVRPIPAIGATDITQRELSPWSPNAHILIGHDPGKSVDVSVFLKAYRVAGVQDPVWFVVDEVTTKEQNYEEHVKEVVHRLRTRWNCNQLDRKGQRPDPDSAVALVRADPYTENGSDEERPDLTFYKIWQKHFVDIRPAAFKPGTAQRSNVPKEGRIDMVNTLLSADGVHRLFVACDSRSQPLAPMLVKAFESLERDGMNRAEKEKKGSDADLSHWPCAVGYGLWAREKPRIERLRGKAA